MLLVTGITGHSGGYFLQELINGGYQDTVRCVVRETSNTASIDNSGLSIEKVVGDLSDQEFIDHVMVGVDTVVHIGSIFYSVVVMKAAVKNKVRRAILVHTTGIYSHHKSASEEYRSIELDIDRLICERNSSIGLIYLRPTMIYGYLNDRNIIVFIKMVDRFRVLPVIDHGKNLVQPVHGRDLGKAYYQVLSESHIMTGDYILSGDEPRTMLQVFKLISGYLSKKTTFVSVPLGVGVFVARCLKVLTLRRVDYIEKVQRMGEDRCFSHEDAAMSFGYRPMSFAEGLRMEVDEYVIRRR